MKDYSSALSNYQKAVKISQQSLPANHPDLVIPYDHIGRIYYSMRDCSTAIFYLEKTLEIVKTNLPSTHLDLAITYTNIGEAYRSMRMYLSVLMIRISL